MTTILACGSNFFGQLGIGTTTVRNNCNELTRFGSNEEQTLDPENVKDIQCGAQFTVLLKKSGELNICGTLNGHVFPTLSPLDIPLPVKCVQLACGRKHVLLLMERNVVMSWGTGYFGQLGHGDDSSWDSPRMISALEPRRLGCRVEAVACGGSHSGALTDTGRVFMWGLNRSGQCGQGSVSKGSSDSILDPRPVDFTNSSPTGGDVGTVRALICGRSHSAALTSTGRVYSWGDAGYGRLGLSDVKKAQVIPAEVLEFRACPVLELASGDFHMMALTRDGEVYSWGYGADGQTGHRTMLNVRLPKRVSFFNAMQVQSIACGATWSMAISAEGGLYCCGYGDGGWLGLQPPQRLDQVELDNLSQQEATMLSESHREIRCFDSRHSVLQPRQVEALRHYFVRSVRGGAGHTVAFCVPRDENKGSSAADAQPKQYSPRMIPTSNAGAGSGASTGAGADAAKEGGRADIVSDRKGTGNLVSSKHDTKGSHHHHHHLPISSLHLSSAGDASGSNSSLSTAHLAHHKSSSNNNSISRADGGVSPISTVEAVNRVPAVLNASSGTSAGVSVGVAMPLSPGSATSQLFSWVRHRKIAELSSYLAAGGDANTPDSAGNTPLIVACQNGHLQACKLLLAHGADMNATNFKGNSALHYCFSYGYDDIGTYLIECGADEFITNLEGLTCYEGLTHSDLDML